MVDEAAGGFHDGALAASDLQEISLLKHVYELLQPVRMGE